MKVYNHSWELEALAVAKVNANSVNMESPAIFRKSVVDYMLKIVLGP